MLHRLLIRKTWWRHQMAAFSSLLVICAGNAPVTVELPAQKPVTRSFDVFFDLHLNKRLSKQSWGWWFETLSRPFWRRCNELILLWWIPSPTTDVFFSNTVLWNWTHFDIHTMAVIFAPTLQTAVPLWKPINEVTFKLASSQYIRSANIRS